MKAEPQISYSDALAGLHFVRGDDSGGAELENTLRNNPKIEYVVPNCRVKPFDAGYTVAGFVRGNGENTTDGRLSLMYGEKEGLSITNPDATRERISIAAQQVGNTIIGHEPRELMFTRLAGGPFQQIAAATSVKAIDIQNGGSATVSGMTLLLNDSGNVEPAANMFGMQQFLSIFGPKTATGDLSGDGIDELVLAGPSVSGTTVKVSFSENPFAWADATFKGTTQKLFTVPANGTKPTYIVSRSEQYIGSPKDYVEVVPYIGNQRFGPPSTVLLLDFYQKIDVGDLNGDGNPDLAVISQQNLRIYFNDGNWNLTLADGWSFPSSSLTAPDVAVADLDNDGRRDILVVDDGGVIVFRNAGNAFPTYSVTTFNNGSGSDFALDDIDRDGYLDIVFTDPNRLVYPAYNTTAATRRANPSAPNAFKFDLDTNYQFVLPGMPYGARGVDPLGVWGTQVTLRSNANPSFVRQIKTDRNGQFTFKNIPAGQYTLTLQDPALLLRTTSMTVNVAGDTAGIAVFGRDDFLPTQIPAPPVSPVSRTNDPGFDLLWGFHNGGQSGGNLDVDMNIPEAWQLTKGSPSVVVAVLDTGVDINHPDLKPNISFNPGSTTQAGYNAVANNNTLIPGLHGTHVAGTIAAVGDNGVGVVGVAPQVKVLPVQVLTDGGGSDATVIAGLQYVRSRKLGGLDIKVANMSLGGASACSEPMRLAIQALHDTGVTVVAAAGNNNSDNDAIAFSPANCPISSLVSVAAVNRTGALADFSNYGATQVDLAAPGVEIWSTVHGHWQEQPSSGFEAIEGTSMAAPAVAGVAALIVSRNPSLTPNQVKQVLLETVKPLGALNGKMVAPGIVDANAALRHPLVTGVPKQLPQPTAPKVSVKKGVMKITMASREGALYAVRLSYLPLKAKKTTKPKVKMVTTSSSTLTVKKVAKGSWSISYRYVSTVPSTLNSVESPVRKVKA
jgi:subtilisin family serine protease